MRSGFCQSPAWPARDIKLTAVHVFPYICICEFVFVVFVFCFFCPADLKAHQAGQRVVADKLHFLKIQFDSPPLHLLSPPAASTPDLYSLLITIIIILIDIVIINSNPVTLWDIEFLSHVLPLLGNVSN